MLDFLFGKKKATNTRGVKGSTRKWESNGDDTVRTVRTYSAVKIGFKSRLACDAVKDTKDSVFLSREAPSLPLPTCTQNNTCECRYIHLEDRRTILRRDTDNGLPPQSRLDDRRSLRERRRLVEPLF